VSFPAMGYDLTLSERSIEDLFFHFPYLVDPRFRVRDIDSRQETLNDGTRVDMVVRCQDTLFIIELKKGDINTADLQQLVHYLREADKKWNKNLRKEGLLFGLGIRDRSQIDTSIAASGFRISIKLYGRDVPTSVKFCRRCRKAVSTAKSECPWCGAQEFIY